MRKSADYVPKVKNIFLVLTLKDFLSNGGWHLSKDFVLAFSIQQFFKQFLFNFEIFSFGVERCHFLNFANKLKVLLLKEAF